MNEEDLKRLKQLPDEELLTMVDNEEIDILDYQPFKTIQSQRLHLLLMRHQK